jgi:hypothetical protein
VANGEVLTATHVSGATRSAEHYASSSTPKHRLQYDAVTGGEGIVVSVSTLFSHHPDDFMSRHKGETDEMLEILTRAAINGRKVTATDS